jgi:hypothetical protein
MTLVPVSRLDDARGDGRAAQCMAGDNQKFLIYQLDF